MKKSIKLFSLLLALLMAASAFVACGDTEETSTNAAASESVEVTTEAADPYLEFMPDITKKDYGADFFLSVMNDSNNLKYHWVEESAGDALSESIYQRQERVRDYLGVEVVGTMTSGFQTYAEDFKTSVKNKDDSVHMLLTHVHQSLEGLITGNYVRDYTTIDQINLDADYWNLNMMDDLALNGKYFLGNSNFNILYTHVIAFNKTMMDQYGDILEEDVYTMVDNYHWTIDQMINLASTVYIDASADGKTEDDTFGLTGVQWVPFIGLLHASNIQYVSMSDSGNYEISVYNKINQSKTADLIQKLSTMVASDYAWFRYRIEDTPVVPLYSGRALMTLQSTNYLPELCDYDVDFGVLPYPMYDEAQADVGYRHLQWGGYTVVPAYLADPVMVAETIEMLSYYSYDVNVTFYEKLLGKQVADAPLDRKMLDLVWDTICSDVGQAYLEATGNWLYMVPELCWTKATTNLASYVGSKEASSNKSIRKFIHEINKLGE